jgi:hypothetical protein
MNNWCIKVFGIQILDFLRVYLPALIFALICVISFLHFLKTKKKGHLMTNIGFVLLTVGWLVMPSFFDYLQIHFITPFRGWEFFYLMYTVFYVVPALLILIGFILLYKEPKAKTIQVSSTPP